MISEAVLLLSQKTFWILKQASGIPATVMPSAEKVRDSGIDNAYDICCTGSKMTNRKSALIRLNKPVLIKL